jgi:tetratricopeptide (TPR) repeat protein
MKISRKPARNDTGDAVVASGKEISNKATTPNSSKGYRGIPKMKLTAVDYYERAGTRSHKNDNKGAIADINRVIRSDPGMAIAYFARGDIKRADGDPKGAIADFTMGIKLDPKCSPAYVCRGNARRNLDDTKGAIADFNKAIKLDAKNSSAYIGLGMARTQKGIGGAIDDFNKAIKLDPKSSEAYFGRGWTRAGQGDTKEAISDFTRAIKLNPQHGMAYMLRGEAYRADSETDKAIADFTKAIKIGVPNSAYVYRNRGFGRLTKEDYSKALEDFDKAIELDPKLAVAYLGRGTAYLAKGNTEKANSDLTLAVKLDASLKSLVDPLLEDCQAPKRDDSAFQHWAKSYRAAARLDGYRAAMRTLSLEHDHHATVRQARRAVRENIELVLVAMSFARLNQAAGFAPVIVKQIYDAEASPCRYIVLFTDYEGNTRWLLVDELREIDLADQVAAGRLRAPTVAEICIRHPGERPFSRGEYARIEKEIEDDLRFDFNESELSIEFNRYSVGLQVCLQELDE